MNPNSNIETLPTKPRYWMYYVKQFARQQLCAACSLVLLTEGQYTCICRLSQTPGDYVGEIVCSHVPQIRWTQ